MNHYDGGTLVSAFIVETGGVDEDAGPQCSGLLRMDCATG